MGWDDNGLPTERRVQNYFGVRCDPSLPYDPDFTPPAKPDPKRQVPISRPNFVELCEQLVEHDEQVFESLWRTLGLSVDWKQPYTTIGAKSQTVSQRAFLRNFARGEAYLPGGADPVGRHLPDRGRAGRAGGPGVPRPLPPGRVPRPRRRAGLHRDHPAGADPAVRGADRAPRRRALPGAVRHDGDLARCSASRSRSLAHPAAEPDKGAGIAMCCTFGDLTDVSGGASCSCRCARSSAATAGCTARPRSGWREPAAAAYAELAGKTTFSAREAMVALLRESGDLDGEPTADPADGELLREGRQAARDRLHPAVVHQERRPRRRAARGADRARRARSSGCPAHMRHRYDNWVERPERRLADLPAAVLRDPVPGLVPARRRGRARLRPPAAAERGRAADRPLDRRPRAATTRTSAARPAASSATRT